MRLSANRDFRWRAAPSTPSVCWRRRFFILAAGLTLLALLAWRFTGRQEPPPGTSAAARASMAAAFQARNALPPVAYGSAWPGPSPKPAAAAVPKPVRRHPRPRGSPVRTGRR